ncbi:thiolase [Variovorax sp. PBS-H4]|uniref:thiolase family protein n=1 Tax=Variovorax sp. PBS-H4 TaxID=434008 RepID=UPI0013178919|nr:thiolase family protein [Variovorax sp. PBS-H4]VTU36534.1 thiolase [Variovorax sp. PBS-H4]
MPFLTDRGVAIAGYAETKLVRRSGRTALSLAGEAVDAVLKQAGIERDRIDGFATTLSMSEGGNPFYSNLLAEGLGLSVSWCQATEIGGASAGGNIIRAAMAIEAGLCEMVLCVATDAVSTVDRSLQSGHRTEYCDPAGYAGPLTAFALLSNVYDQRYGLPHDALAKLAVTQRNGALLNPNACDVLRKPLTERDYLDSKVVSDPLRMLDCVMRCDGASAVLVTSSKLARQLGLKMAHPIGYAERINFDPREECGDMLRTGFSEVAPRAFRQAAMRPRDVKMLHWYDDFLIALILQLEQTGFCEAGQGGAFVAAHDFNIGGDLPLNTSGGQISAGQPGLAGGGVNLVECIRQLFGEAGERQVKDHGNAMLTGIGVIQYARTWGTSSVMLLERGQ